MNGCIAPLAAMGSATVETSVPSVRRSSTKTAVDAALSAVCPSPTRSTRKVSGLQLALASQALTLSLEQMVPTASFGFEATPAVQRSLVQGFPSTGRSPLSMAETRLPLPSQVVLWQFPTASVTTVFACVYATPHWPAMQVGCPQAVVAPGQPLASAQATPCPPAPAAPPPAPAALPAPAAPPPVPARAARAAAPPATPAAPAAPSAPPPAPADRHHPPRTPPARAPPPLPAAPPRPAPPAPVTAAAGPVPAGTPVPANRHPAPAPRASSPRRRHPLVAISR